MLGDLPAIRATGRRFCDAYCMIAGRGLAGERCLRCGSSMRAAFQLQADR